MSLKFERNETKLEGRKNVRKSARVDMFFFTLSCALLFFCFLVLVAPFIFGMCFSLYSAIKMSSLHLFLCSFYVTNLMLSLTNIWLTFYASKIVRLTCSKLFYGTSFRYTTRYRDLLVENWLSYKLKTLKRFTHVFFCEWLPLKEIEAKKLCSHKNLITLSSFHWLFD